jgi:hypothetical protein
MEQAFGVEWAEGRESAKLRVDDDIDTQSRSQLKQAILSERSMREK